MNQGHDVVEFIHGNDIRPADHPLLQYQFHGLPFERDVDELMELFQKRIPMFRQLNSLTFRELIIESTLTASYPSGPTMDEALEKMRALRTTLGARQPARARRRSSVRATRSTMPARLVPRSSRSLPAK